jgi:hypothetical protein
MAKFFRIYQKIFLISYFSGNLKNFLENNINSSFQKAVLKTFFTHEKGTLLPEKGHLAKLGGGGGRFLRSWP